jgi:nitroreductase
VVTETQMSFAAAVEGRRSVRRYRPDPVPREDVERMVALAARAASAGNAQMWRFIAVQDHEVLQAMKRAVNERLDEMSAWPELAAERKAIKAVRAYATFFSEAPLCFAVLGLPYSSHTDVLLSERGLSREERDRLRQRPDLQSVGAAVQLLITAAHSLGYGACWMSAPVLAAEGLERVLGVEAPAQLVALVPAGRPAGSPRRSGRLPLDEILSFR